MTSDDNRTPPLHDDDEDDDIDEEDTEEEEVEEDEEEDDDGDLTAGNNSSNNLIIKQEQEPADDENQDPTVSRNSDLSTSIIIAVSPSIVHNLSGSAPNKPGIVDGTEPEPSIRVASISSLFSQQQPATGDDQARKLFQRLWTDEDEIGLLQGFLDYSTQRGTSHNNPHDTALFYDQIKSKLQLDFNKNQLVEKLRRLKKKYRNVLARVSSGKEISFKSPHDQASFEIATKIWGTTDHAATSSHKDHNVQNHHIYQQQMLQRRIDVDDDMPPTFNPTNTNLNLNFASHFNSSHHNDRVIVADERKSQQKSSKKRLREKTDDTRVLMDQMGTAAVPTGSTHAQIPIWPLGMGSSTPLMAEEKAKNKIPPMFRDMYDRSRDSRGFVDGIVSPVPLSFGGSTVNMFGAGMEVADDRWRKQQILELEVYSKRLELVQEQIKLNLEQLRSQGS